MKLIVYPDPILTKISEPVTEFNAEMQQLCVDMIDTMTEHNGMGLSAVQVGVLKRIVVMQVVDGNGNPSEPSSYYVFANPEIVETDGTFVFSEGCLSVPGYFESRERANKILLRWDSPSSGVAQEDYFEGVSAFCLQHELDHLEGKLFIDDLSPLKKDRVRAKIKKTLKRNQ